MVKDIFQVQPKDYSHDNNYYTILSICMTMYNCIYENGQNKVSQYIHIRGITRRLYGLSILHINNILKIS